MEIVTYVLDGALQHKDSMGNGSVIRPGDVQRMSAGTGVVHSEFNPSPTEPVHLLQIWLLPAATGRPPEYEQKTFPESELRDTLRLIADPDGRDGAVTIHQDVRLYAGRLGAGREVRQTLAASRFAWLHLARGGARVNDVLLGAGDGAALSGETALAVSATTAAEVLLFDLA